MVPLDGFWRYHRETKQGLNDARRNPPYLR